MNKNILSMIMVLFLAGCAIGPDYKRPVIDTPGAWRLEEKGVSDLANTAWWGQFGDPVLDGLIRTALKENYDLRIATARERGDPLL